MRSLVSTLTVFLLIGLFNDTTLPPTITSTPVTHVLVSQPYVYDADATGDPAPVFTLAEAFPGMVLDAGTGVLTWTPAITGTFDLTVTASNPAGTDSQTISLTVLPKAGYLWPAAAWPEAAPEEVGMDPDRLEEAQNFAQNGGGAGYIIRYGRLVKAWGDPEELFELRSTTKSIGSAALGLAIKAGLISLDDRAQQVYPSFGIPPQGNTVTGWLDDITLRQLAAHTAGFDMPGGYAALRFQPGTVWYYSDSGANWLAEILTQVFGEDLNDRMWREVFTPVGIQEDSLIWRENLYRPQKVNGITNREFASGIRADVDALARLGYLYLRQGGWKGENILPVDFINEARRAVPGSVGLPESDPLNDCNASDHHGLLWWTNADGSLANVPRDAYWSWGLDENLVLVIPSLDIVAARVGFSLQNGEFSSCYSVLQPFIEPVVQSVQNAPRRGQPPTLVVTAPVRGAAYLVGQAIPIRAQATDPDGSLAVVSFYAGETWLGESRAAPYALDWESAPLGSHNLTVRAIDESGLETRFSLWVDVVTQPPEENQSPLVSITTPDNGAIYPPGVPVRIEAQAFDPNGEINRVEYYVGQTLLGTVTSPPYTFYWLGAPTGSFNLAARAVDDAGASASAQVRITILSADSPLPPVVVTDFVYFPQVQLP